MLAGDLNTIATPCAGCFAMTEVHHGSNVAALQTEAIYEAERDEWVVNTPNDGAIKW